MSKRHRPTSTSSIHTVPGVPYQPPLTPVDEGSDSDTTEAASVGNATASSTTSGSISDQSYFHPRPMNFSRPRPVDFSPAHKVHHDRTDSSSSTLSVSNDLQRAPLTKHFDSYKEVTALPSQADFSFGELQYDTPTLTNDKADFDWDASLDGMRPSQRAIDYLNQRAAVEVHKSSSAAPVELAGSEPQANGNAKHTRMTSTESDEWEGEDARSHHTASDNDEQNEKGKTPWKSSSFDVSSLTQSELKKLRKKGINPALYAEMKAARKGKGSWINPLAGNTYLS